ncbi:Tat pathway signal protein [Halorutilales archaeon Cl-col2-1]
MDRSGSRSQSRDNVRGISRREFLKSAVAIGGASALAACMGRSDDSIPRGGTSNLPERQHAWNDYLRRDDHGNPLNPRHHVLVFLDYSGDVPSEEDRDSVEESLSDLEEAFAWGSDGLLFTVGYSPYYFERFDADTPIELPKPEPLADFESPEPDKHDAVLHLASDHATAVLTAEEALLGEVDEANGVKISRLDGVFERNERRTGFVGEGLPAENQDVDGIPDSEPVDEDAPMYMGFKSGYSKNQATEDRVTIDEGRFAGGTTQHVSRLRLRLEQWYEQDSRYQRVGKMFCPAHAQEGRVEETGESLGDSSRMEDCGEAVESARNNGMVGHSQKMVSARRDGSPVMIRRDFDSTDGGEAGLHFVALQESISDFVSTRKAMNGTGVSRSSPVGTKTNNGILQYISVERRGNYLVPPRSLRSLPAPNP